MYLNCFLRLYSFQILQLKFLYRNHSIKIAHLSLANKCVHRRGKCKTLLSSLSRRANFNDIYSDCIKYSINGYITFVKYNILLCFFFILVHSHMFAY